VRTGENGLRVAPIPGWDSELVYAPQDVLESGARPSGKVVVFDDEGLNTGLGIAEVLAAAGAEVEFLSTTADVAAPLAATGELPVILERLASYGVALSTRSLITEIDGHEVKVLDIGSKAERTIPVDGVVLVTMRRSESAL